MAKYPSISIARAKQDFYKIVKSLLNKDSTSGLQSFLAKTVTGTLA